MRTEKQAKSIKCQIETDKVQRKSQLLTNQPNKFDFNRLYTKQW